jgi:hypothetical protein
MDQSVGHPDHVLPGEISELGPSFKTYLAGRFANGLNSMQDGLELWSVRADFRGLS